MTTSEFALLEAIAADPENDVPRLVYADWLDQSSSSAAQAQAEFIRLQVRLARLEKGSPEARLANENLLHALHQQEQELLETYKEQWLGPLSGVTAMDAVPERCFSRGLVERATLTVAELFEHQHELGRRFPALRDLTLRHGWAAQLAQLGQCPLLAQLETLVLDARQDHQFDRLAFETPEAQLLARSQFLSRLRRLTLGWTHVGRVGGIALANSAGLPQLEELCVLEDTFGGSLVDILAHATGFPALAKLVLSHNQIVLDDIPLLVSSPLMRQIRELHLPGQSLGVRGLQILLEAGELEQLRYLGLGENRLTPPAVELLASSRRLAGLQGLDLSDNPVDDSSVKALLASPAMEGLQELSLARTDVTEEGVLTLAASPKSASLVRLDLRYTSLGDAAVEALCTSENLRQLRDLYPSSQLSDASRGRLSRRFQTSR